MRDIPWNKSVKVRKKQRTSCKLSVCMIVRNESAVLQRCIDSLQNICDELCIVDTGSSDNTVEIAHDNRAIVERFTGCNDEAGQIVDFALARNKSLSLASGDWVLQIDADELLLSGHDRIRVLTEDDGLDQIGVLMSSEGANWISVRIFRNIDGLHYKSRIHEYLVGTGTFVADRLICIENRPNKQSKESASDRNVRLCRLALKDNPEDGRLYHYLGNEYRKLRRFSEAIEAYRRALTCGNYRVGLYHSSYYLGVSCLMVEDWEGAIDAAFQCLRIDPRYAEAPCLLGDVYSCTGNIYHAMEWYRTALSKKGPPEDAVMAVQDWAYLDHPMKRLQKLQAISEVTEMSIMPVKLDDT